MNKTIVTGVIIAIVFCAGGFWGGMTYAQNQAASARAAFAGGNFAGRTGAAGFTGRGAAAGGATFGTILSMGNGSITIQMPTSTSTSATTGTKIVLYDNSTQIQALESVPASNLKVGETVTVNGTANSDGSVTASMIEVRPAGMPRGAGAQPTTPTNQ